LAPPALLALLAQREPLELLAPRVRQVPLVLRVPLVLPGQLAPRVRQVPLVPRAPPEPQVPPAQLAL
jgi:hypothetical protein